MKEQNLAKRQEYMRAVEVAAAAEQLYAADFLAAQQAFDAEQRLKVTKFHAKQKQELEALLQRGSRGRDELELKRAAEVERRLYRYRNTLAVSICCAVLGLAAFSYARPQLGLCQVINCQWCVIGCTPARCKQQHHHCTRMRNRSSRRCTGSRWCSWRRSWMPKSKLARLCHCVMRARFAAGGKPSMLRHFDDSCAYRFVLLSNTAVSDIVHISPPGRITGSPFSQDAP